MRRLIIYIMVCVALCACSESSSEIDSTKQKVVFNVEVSAPDTRTQLVNENGKYKAIWKAGDYYIIAQLAEKNCSFCSGNVEADAPSINIVAEFEQIEGSSYRYLFASPNLAVSADCATLGFPLSSRQTPQGMDTFDGKADVILSDVVEMENQPSGQTVTFNTMRVSAVGKVTVKNVALEEGDAVRSITFECEHPLAGDVNNVVVEDIIAGNDPLANCVIDKASNSVTVVLYEPQTGDFTCFFSCIPATLAAGESYTVTLETVHKHTFVKQATIPSELTFSSGDMTTFTVNMAGIVADAPAADSANCQILYTSTDGQVVTPYATDAFGANIVSNTYENGQGVIKFDGEVTKIGYMAFYERSTLASIVIPQSVTSIGRYAFHRNTALTTITLPESVTAIDLNPFIGCTNLAEFKGKFATSDGRSLVVDTSLHAIAPAGITEYAVPENVTAICDDTFNACGSITSVTIPDSVISIGNYAFYNCGQLANIEIGNGVTTIGSSAFHACGSLTSITIPDSVTSIGETAFYDCSSLQSVYCKPITPPTMGAFAIYYVSGANIYPIDCQIYVPAASVEAYKAADGWSDYADAIVAEVNEANCQILYTSTDGAVVTPYATDVFGANITSNTYENGQGVIKFDGEVTQIGSSAFSVCYRLASITIPNSVTSIEHNAFFNCNSLTSIAIPDSVTKINNQAFRECVSLASVTIGNGVTSIGYWAFYGCSSLTSVTIPDSVTTLETNPFEDCEKLFEFNGKFASADKRCLIVDGVLNSFAPAGLTEYTILDGVTVIAQLAFDNCSNLTSITIPDSVTSIVDGAFYGCSSLTDVCCKPITPPTAIKGTSSSWDAFDSNATDRKIYVPSASVDAYKAAEGWSEYADAIVAEEGGNGDVTIADIDMVFVAGGTFTMGSDDSDAESDEKPTHSVTVSDFYIGKYEVTQAQWRAVMGSNPSYFTGDDLPVEQVSWNDIQEFITKLNTQTGKNYRLPTEAEWEYAARGGNKSNEYKYSGSNAIDDVAWYYDNSNSTTHAVGQKQPNELGIYDMSGNVLEWCQDWSGSYSSDSQTNPTGPESGSNRILRGGCWNYYARYCRVYYRDGFAPDLRGSGIGFRLCLSE